MSGPKTLVASQNVLVATAGGASPNGTAAAGDGVPLLGDGDGRIYVVPTTSGGITPSDLTRGAVEAANSGNLVSGAASLSSLLVTSLDTSNITWLLFFDSTGSTAGTADWTVPIQIPPSGSAAFELPNAEEFATGITAALSTAPGTLTGSPSMWLNVWYAT